MSARKKRALGAVSAVASLALIGGVAAQLTTSTTSEVQHIGTGTAALALDAVAPVVWTQPITNLAAGDSVQRFVDLRNAGSLKLAGLTLSQTNTLGAMLTGTSDVLVKLESCTVAWNTTSGACDGQSALALTNSSVASWGTSTKALSTFEDFGAGDVRHLKITTSLAATAPNAAQALAGDITYTFAGAQRSAADAGASGTVSGASSALQQPGAIKTEVLSDSSVKVSFTDTNAGAATYAVSWAESGNTSAVPQQAIVPAGQTSYTVTGLSAGKSYDFAVAVAKNGISAATAPVAATPRPATTPQVSLSSASWQSGVVPDSPNSGHYYSASATDAQGRIYLMGGGGIAAVDRYDPATNKWSSVAPMPTIKRSSSGVADAEGNIYTIGGYDSATNGFLTVVQKYDPKTDKWTTVSPLKTGRRFASAALGSDGMIYVSGGQTGDYTYTSSMERYDPKTDKWTTLASMPTAKFIASMVASTNGSLYVMGGTTNGTVTLNEVHRYDIATDKWVAMPSMGTSRQGLGSVIDSTGVIYAIGGITYGSSFTYLSTTEKYDPATNKWTPAQSLNTVHGNANVEKDNQGRVYVMSGLTSAGWSNAVERLG